MKFRLLFFLLNGIFSSSYAQKENYNWALFNNILLNFSDSQTTVQTNIATLVTQSVACISDKDGNLLFYTDCGHIYDKNNVLVYSSPRDLGLTVKGNFVVPKPKMPTIFYQIVFTNNLQKSEFYLVINSIKVENPYAIQVINTQVIKNDTLLNQATNLILRHSNTFDYWLLTGWGNQLETYLITENGINTPPTIFTFQETISSWDMKQSRDGTKILGLDAQNLHIFDFDAVKGTISNPKKIPFSGSLIEFSPDGSKLWTIERKQMITNIDTLYVIQYDATLIDTPSLFLQSAVIVAKEERSSFTSSADLQLTPNGDIYLGISGLEYIGIIKNPNQTPPNCYFIKDGLYLNGKIAGRGFPHFLDSPKASILASIECDLVHFFCVNALPQSALWNFGDGSTSTDLNPSHTYVNSGTYKVEVLVNYADGTSQTLTKSITIQGKPSKITILHD